MKHTERIARSMRSQIEKGVDIEVVLSKTEEVLKENRQQMFLPGALECLSVLLKRDQDYSTLVIQSPFLLEESQADQISKNLTGEPKTRRTLQINQDLLAGFKATYKGKVYDGSARQYITKLGNQ